MHPGVELKFDPLARVSPVTLRQEDPADGSAQSTERINWRIGGLAVGTGLIATVAGLTVAEFDRSAVAAVLINVGTAMGLLLVVLWFEARVVKRVERAAKATANETVERVTADLRERVVRLENLEEAQAEERGRRRDAASAPVRAMREEQLSAQVVGEVLADAHGRGLFGPGFCVRTSAEADCHLLYFLPLRSPNDIPILWLDVEPFEMGEPIDLDGQTIAGPVPRETTAMWIYDQDAAEVASDIEAGLEKTNRTLNGFSLRYALEQLDSSVEIATRSREVEAGDSARLRGSLEMLINEYWAVTTYGLEAVDSSTALTVAWSSFVGCSGASVLHPTQLKQVLPADESPAGYDSAIEWVTQRLRWLPPDDPQGLARLAPGRDRVQPG